MNIVRNILYFMKRTKQNKDKNIYSKINMQQSTKLTL